MNHIKRKHPTYLVNAQNVIVIEPTKNIASSTASTSTTTSTITVLPTSSISQESYKDDTSSVADGSHQEEAYSDTNTVIQKKKQPHINQAFKHMKAFSDGGIMEAKITNSLLYMIAKDNLPLSTTENKGFRRFLKVAVPLYKAPNRKTITKLMNDKYKVISDKLKAEFLNVDNFTLTSDVWTDTLNTKSFFGLTVHYVSQNVKLESISIGTQPLVSNHTGTYLGQVLKCMCEEWNIDQDKIVAVVTDNGKNIVKAVGDTFGKRRHLPCFAHTLNLIVMDSLKDTNVNEMISKVKSIVAFFKHSVVAMDELRSIQIANGKSEGEVLKLKQECPTRWNSLFYMLQRFFRISTILFKYSTPTMLTYEEINICKDVVTILRPLEAITVEISGENYLTSSKIIPIVNCLTKTYENMEIKTEVAQQLLGNILSQINRRFNSDDSNPEKNSILAISTLLDPRFKKLHFRSSLTLSNAIQKVNNLIYVIKEIEDNTTNKNEVHLNVHLNSNGLWNIHEQLVVASTNQKLDEVGGISVELRQYLNQPVTNRFDDPLKCWDSLKTVYPNLHKIALKYLSVVGTSVSSERLFSKAGNILTEKRNRLIGKNLSTLVFLHSISETPWNL